MENVMTITYFISTGLTTIMLGVIGFFLKQFYRSVKELTKTVDKLNVVVTVEGERISNMKEKYNEFVVSMDKLHSCVNNHESRITVIETKINN